MIISEELVWNNFVVGKEACAKELLEKKGYFFVD
jgi:hypothetical protein